MTAITCATDTRVLGTRMRQFAHFPGIQRAAPHCGWRPWRMRNICVLYTYIHELLRARCFPVNVTLRRG